MLRDVRLCLALTFLAGAGCSLTLEAPEVLSNACASDEDCGLDAACDEEHGMCIALNAEPLPLGMVVYPGGASEGVAFPAFEVDGPAVRDFELPSSIVAAGRVRHPSMDESVPAQLRFVRQSAFQGGDPQEIAVSTSSEPQELSFGVEADYQVRISRGGTYDVRVEPTGDAARVYPPLVLSDVRAPEEGDLWKLDVDFPESFATVEGTIVSVVDGEEVPEDGLQVRAVDAHGRVVSSTAITGMGAALPLRESDPGSFRIRLRPGVETFLLRISGGDARPLFPVITVDPDLVHPEGIVVPRLEPVRYEALVEGSTPSGNVAVPDAVVTLRSRDVFGEFPDVHGTFRASATTDEMGRFEVDVLPGTYEVIVTPSGQAELAVLAQHVTIEGGSEVVRGQLFTVPQRARLGGSLETSDGRPTVGANVRATALRRALSEDDVVGRFNRSAETATDATGQFTLQVDTGAYDVTIRAPSGSRFPWVVAPDWVFDRSASETTEHFTLWAPVPLRGVVYGEEGRAMADAELKAFVLLSSPDGEARAMEVARTVAGPDGRYELLLPPQL